MKNQNENTEMTLRDHMAAKALEALVPQLNYLTRARFLFGLGYSASKAEQLIASAAYDIADAMLAARSAKP